MSGQQTGGMPKWLVGCGIGCAVVVVVGIIGIVALGGLSYFMFDKVMQEGKIELVKELNREYQKLNDEGKIPEEHRPVLDELVALAKGDEVSAMAIGMCVMTIDTAFQDGEISEDEAQAFVLYRDFLKENPDAGMMAVATFLSEHPELGIDPSDLQNGMAIEGSEIEVIVDSDEEPVEEEPVEEEAVEQGE